MTGLGWRGIAVSLAVSLALAGVSLSPTTQRLEGLSADLLFWLRHAFFGPLHGPDDSGVAIIAIDEETYRRPPFKDVPRAMWTPEMARVLSAVLDGGATALGQDILLPTSVEGYLPGFDREYLMALRSGASEGRIVLGEVQHTVRPISPFAGHVFAARGPQNLRVVNLFRDDDGVIRRIPVSFERVREGVGPVREVSFAVEIAARAMGVTPAFGAKGGVTLGTRELPGAGANGFLLNFSGGERSLPVYSFADLVACVEAEEHSYFERAFAGRVVLFGVALDVEDRKLTSARHVTGPDGAWFAERCKLPVMSALYDREIVRDTLPGVFLFATAVNNILRDEILEEVSAPAAGIIVACAVLLVAAAVLMLPIPATLGTVVAGSIAWTAIATALFEANVFVPFLDPIAAAVVGGAVMLGYRFTVTDRLRRQIQNAFSFYLPPQVIDRMIEEDRLPVLGGETREITILFSDLAGFTALSEDLEPDVVVSIMNRYFSTVSSTIEAHSGCVCMYIGDAVFAMFGAPIEDPDHPRHAVEAALACREAITALEAQLDLPAGRRIRTRTGIATGPALIGNIGSTRRFNYTAMGDTVNLAHRLETANKVYGTDILLSEETALRIAEHIPVRPLERIRVQGRAAPVLVHQPLDVPASVHHESVDPFREAAALRDRRDLRGALAVLERVRHVPPAEVLIEHLAALDENTSATDSVPVFELQSK